MKLYTEHLYLDSGVMHERVHQMVSQNLKPEYVDLRAVPSDSEDHAYLVGKVSVLTVPFEDADAAVDRTEVIVCGCPQYHYRCSEGFENGDVPVTDLQECKHAGEYREIRAKNDENQSTL